jgi:antitoxin component HigA of HigAB toxin-antitoxin module
MTARLTLDEPRLLANADEYGAAVAEIASLLNEKIKPGSAREARLDFLTLLVEDYDRRNYALPGEEVTPQEVVLFVLEQRGMERLDLNDAMGGKARVSEFFTGKRGLSMSQVVALRELLGVSADLLIGYHSDRWLYGAVTKPGKAPNVAEPAPNKFHVRRVAPAKTDSAVAKKKKAPNRKKTPATASTGRRRRPG